MHSFARRLLGSISLLACLCGAAAAETSLDPSFYVGGIRALPFDVAPPDSDRLVRVLPTADGKYIAVGTASINGGGVGVALARLLPNGQLDPSFDGDGKRVKEACMSAVRDAILDPFGRIVVVGDTFCSSDGSIDAAVLRFNTDGSDDTTFAGDGGLGFAFPGGVADDSAESVIWDGSTSGLVVGGSRKASGNVRVAHLIQISSTGVVSTDKQLFTFGVDSRIVRGVVVDAGTSLWLSEQVGETGGIIGELYRLKHSDMSLDPAFGTSGAQVLAHYPAAGSNYVACAATGTTYVPRTLIRTGGRAVVLSTVFNGAQVLSQFTAVDDDTAANYQSGCLNPGSETTAAIYDVVAGHEGDTLYAATVVGYPPALGLWRLTMDPENTLGWIADPTFHGGLPISAIFGAADGQTPVSAGKSILRDGERYVIGGERVWSGADSDFAFARFADPVMFVDGFE